MLNMVKSIILFDGVCNLCSGWIDFVIQRDPRARFRFAALQSEAGKKILAQHGLSNSEMTSMYLIEGDRVYAQSSAILRIASGLSGLWRILSVFLIVPAFLRNAVYDFIAQRRYRWYGRRESCRMPTLDEQKRFVS